MPWKFRAFDDDLEVNDDETAHSHDPTYDLDPDLISGAEAAFEHIHVTEDSSSLGENQEDFVDPLHCPLPKKPAGEVLLTSRTKAEWNEMLFGNNDLQMRFCCQ